MIDIVGRKQWFFLVSWLLVIMGIVALVISQVHLGSPLRLGTDFTGGTSFTLQFSSPVEKSRLVQEMSTLGYSQADITGAGTNSFSVVYGAEISDQEMQALQASLETDLGTQVQVSDYSYISGIISAATARNAGIAVIVASIAMLFYVVWAFRRMPSPFRWGTVAIVALLHDVFIVVGIFAILGLLAGVQIGTLFITGLLTVVGYSINNTVVVFDRIRENKARGISPDFAVTVNSSIVETLGRCLNTSLTTFFVVLALFLFGGASIHYFVLVLLLGVVVGLYDSVFIAGELLVVWEKGEWRSLLPLTRRSTQPELSR
jgi:preprotein translocase subunit SecF